MKKAFLLPVAFVALSLFSCTSPSGGGGGSGSAGSTATIPAEGITGSSVFIAGRNITIKPFIMEDHEVTQGEYKAIMGTNPSYNKAGDNYPVEEVSWYDALVYCNKRSIAEGKTPCYTINGSTNPSSWGAVPTSNNATWDAVTCNFNANGYRLPTEAEWEYCARGKNLTNQGQTTYSGSNNIDDVAWYYDNSGGKTHPVKQKQANKAGLYDMSGNVWEWCWDWYSSINASTPASGVPSGSYRVDRGGVWGNSASFCTVADRDYSYPYGRYYSVGFRVCRSSSNKYNMAGFTVHHINYFTNRFFPLRYGVAPYTTNNFALIFYINADELPAIGS